MNNHRRMNDAPLPAPHLMDTKSTTAGIKDIARALGISIGTVDRALHGRAGVSKTTQARDPLSTPLYPGKDRIRKSRHIPARRRKKLSDRPSHATYFLPQQPSSLHGTLRRPLGLRTILGACLKTKQLLSATLLHTLLYFADKTPASISSSVRPFVSGTKAKTNAAPIMQMVPYPRKVPELPSA